MARIRSIKPSIWTDEKFISLSRDARLLVIGMISHADDEGRLFASAAKLAGDVFPADDLKPGQLIRWRDEAEATGLFRLYRAGSVEYAVFPNWSKHQRISKPQPSILPAPAQSRNDSALSRGTIPHSVAERDGNDSALAPDPDAEPPGNDSATDHVPRARAVGDRRQETGIPTTSDAGRPRRRPKAEDPERAKNAGDVVAAFAEGAKASGQPEPATSIRARVGRDARQLLSEGYDPEDLIKSAYRMGAGEWNDLAVQVRKDAAATTIGNSRRGHQTYQNPPDDSVYEEKL